MKKRISLLALLLILCFTTALAEGALPAPRLSLADKIKQAKERSFLSSEKPSLINWRDEPVSRELPSVLDMAGADDFSVSEKKNHDAYCKIVFKAYDPDKLDFALEYVGILVHDCGYKLSYEDIGEMKSYGYRSSAWYLQHSDPEVGSDEPYEEEGRECDVFIRLNQYFDDGDCTLAIYHVDELSHSDAENAGSGSSSGSSKSYCSYCNNGSCNYCGGSGWISTWSGTERVRQDCSMCIGGRCTRC